MKIVVSQISESGLEFEGETALKIGPGRQIEEVRYRLNLDKLGTDVFIRGEISADMSLSCSRCLKDFTERLSISIDLAYCPAGSLGGEGEHEIVPDELSTGFYQDDKIDLMEVIREQLLLGVPMKPLCEDDCSGICQKCGASLNETACGCAKDSVDPRFQVLEKLIDKKE